MEKIITLSDRIDSSNAFEEEKKIFKDLEAYDEIILDAEKLNYISSIGLRIILKIKKEYPKTKIINCSNQVYEIFDMTGFSQMIDIKKRYREISIDGCEIIGEGAYGIIYRIDPETIVKVYKNPNSLEEIIRERENARKAFILGIPTAISYEIVRVGNLYGTIFEMLDAKSFALLLRDGEDLEKLVIESVKLLKLMHNTKDINNDLPNKNEEVIDWAIYCKKYLPKNIGDKLVKLMKEIPKENTIIHGDFHVKNLMSLKDQVLLIDMETISVGHPILELACSYSIYEGFECLDPKNPEKFLGIPRKQCREFFDLTLKYYFSDLNDGQIEEIKKMIKVICYTRLLRRQIKHFGLNDNKSKASIEFCKNYLIENIPNINKLYF